MTTEAAAAMAKKAETRWSKLRHAGGAAGDVPELLEAMRAKEPRERATAVRRSWSRLYADDAWFSAQPPFVEALLALAEDPEVEDRHKLLSLAVNIVVQGTGDKVPRGLDLGEPDVARRYAEGIPARLYGALRERAPFLVGLLASGRDPGRRAPLRAAAVECLAFLPDAAPAALDPLARAIAEERDEAVLATMLHGLGLLIRASGERGRRSVLEAHTTTDHPPLVRACAHTGLLAFEPDRYGPAVRDLFVEAIEGPPPSADTFPFKGGRLDQMFSECVFGAAGKPALTELHLAVIDRGTAPEDTLERVIEDIFAVNFASGHNALREDFTEEQLALLERLSQREIEAPFHDIGVPERLAVRRRWLELDPPGPLNARIEVVRRKERHVWPVWKALLEAEPTPEARPDLLRKHLSPLQILELDADVTFLEREIEFTGLDLGSEVVRESLDRAGADALPWARATSERLFGEPTRIPWFRGTTLLPIVRALGPGEMLDPRYDALVYPSASDEAELAVVREVLAAIPMSRREALFVRTAEASSLPELTFRATFPLCPTPGFTRALLEALDAKQASTPEAFHVHGAAETYAAMVEVARAHPDVEGVIADYTPKDEALARALAKARGRKKR